MGTFFMALLALITGLARVLAFGPNTADIVGYKLEHYSPSMALHTMMKA